MSALWNHRPMLSHGVLNPTMRVLSHGGGVQTSALALAAEDGLCGPPPDYACLGDPGGESREVWAYLEMIRARVSFPIESLMLEDLKDHIRRSKLPDGGRVLALPYYTLGPNGEKGMTMRQCTRDAKIEAVTQSIRRRLGTPFGQRPSMDTFVEVWIGISTDEKDRAGGWPARPWQHVRYPLLELNWSRSDCVDFIASKGLPPAPFSMCTFCCFRDNFRWRHLRDTCPDEWEEACELDDLLRVGGPPNGLDHLPFLHFDRVPLRGADLGGDATQMAFDCMGGCAL